MRNFFRNSLIILASGALMSPAAVGVAHAQSSFGSSSVENIGTGISTPLPTRDAKAVEFESLVEEFFTITGHTKTDNAEAIADDYYQRAVDGELEFMDDMYFTDAVESEGLFVVVNAMPPEFIDNEISILKRNIALVKPDDAQVSGEIGARVDLKNGRYYSVQVYID